MTAVLWPYTLRHVIGTGCRFRSASCFVWLCLPVGANMVSHYLICQLIFNASRMLTPVGDFDPHRRQRCSFHARDSLQMVTELSQSPLHALGTIYHPVSLQRPRRLLSERDSNPNFFSQFFALTVYMRMHVLFYMPLTYVYFLFKRLCGLCTVSILYSALAAKFSLCHVNLFVN